MSETTESGVLYNQAWLAYKDCRYVDAIALLEESLKAHGHFKSCELLGVCLLEIGNSDQALQRFEQAFLMNEKSSKTGCLLAQQLLDSGDASRSREIVEMVLLNNTSYGPARRLLQQLDALKS